MEPSHAIKQPPVANEPRLFEFLDQFGPIGDQVRQLERTGAVGVGHERLALLGWHAENCRRGDGLLQLAAA